MNIKFEKTVSNSYSFLNFVIKMDYSTNNILATTSYKGTIYYHTTPHQTTASKTMYNILQNV